MDSWKLKTQGVRAPPPESSACTWPTLLLQNPLLPTALGGARPIPTRESLTPLPSPGPFPDPSWDFFQLTATSAHHPESRGLEQSLGLMCLCVRQPAGARKRPGELRNSGRAGLR